MDPREDRFIVEAFDCRPDGCIKPNALLQYLQEAAARHAEPVFNHLFYFFSTL